MISTEIVCVWAAGDEYYRKALSVCRGESVERRESPHGVSDYTGRSTVRARITFSSKSTIEFVATVDLLHVLVQKQLIQKNKIVIPCYCKVMLEPDLLKPGRQITAYRNCGSRRITLCCRPVASCCRSLRSGLIRREHRSRCLPLQERARRGPVTISGDRASKRCEIRDFQSGIGGMVSAMCIRQCRIPSS